MVGLDSTVIVIQTQQRYCYKAFAYATKVLRIEIQEVKLCLQRIDGRLILLKRRFQ